MDIIKSLPNTPYWAVIFSNQRTENETGAYDVMAERMAELASQQPGCLGFDTTRGADGFGITVSYWQSLEAIQVWRDHPEHQEAQALGREKWYEEFDLHIARVDRSYHYDAALECDL